MRLLRWVGLMGVLAIAGCGGGGSSSVSGGGGGSNNNNSGGNPPAPPAPTTLNFSVPLFNSTKQATLVRRNMPASESGSSLTVVSASTNKAAGEEAPGKDLPPELVAQHLADLTNPSTRNRADEIRPRFQQLAQGADQNFLIVTNNQTVTCRKILAESQTVHCTIFAQVVGGNPILSEATALQIQAKWDEAGTGIYDTDRSIFGSEWTTGGGRDGDAKVNLVFLNGSGIGGSNYFGFVSPADEGTTASSNQGEILYLNFDKFETDGFNVYSTMAHEFQHLIALNTKLIRQGAFNGQIENAAIDEGKAVLAEDLNGYGLEAVGGGNNFTFVATRAFLQNPGAQGIFQFNGNLDAYGRDYAFMRYLLDRFGLVAFQAYAQSSGSGLAQLNTSFGSASSIFTDWTNALIASPLAGSVPSNLRYTGPFSPGRSYSSIRGLTGAQTLPTLTPGQTVSPPTGSQTTTLGPWTFSTVRYQNGTGSTLNVTVQVDSGQGASMVVENPTGTFGGVQ